MSVSLEWSPRPAGASPGERADVDPDAPRYRLEADDARALLQEAEGDLPRLHAEHVTPEGGCKGCLACGHPELFTQRDFPRSVGIAIVVLAAILAPATRYISLAVAALLDFLLFHFSGKVVVCYVCEAAHRGFPERPRHPAFDREIDERLRYGAKAVMGKPMRPEGTADAPEPEH